MNKMRLSLFLCALGVISATQVACSSSLNEKLLWAVFSGDYAQMNKFLRAGADANAVLPIVALHGYEQAVDQLLQAGADVNATNNGGDTALHFARNCAIAQRLVQAGADFEALNSQQKSPLVSCADSSCWRGDPSVAEVIGYLISVGAGIDDLLNSDRFREHLRPHVDLIKSRAAFLRDLLKGQDLLKDQGLYSVLEDLVGQYAGFPISKKAVGKMEARLQ